MSACAGKIPNLDRVTKKEVRIWIRYGIFVILNMRKHTHTDNSLVRFNSIHGASISTTRRKSFKCCDSLCARCALSTCNN